MHLIQIAQILVLVTLANGGPIVTKKIFGSHFSSPLDAGALFFDDRPLFGPSKTVRGILASFLLTTAGALLLGLGLTIGAIVAAAAMAGDLFSSFSKRRLNLQPGTRVGSNTRVPLSNASLPRCPLIDQYRRRAWRWGIFSRRANPLPPFVSGSYT